MSLIEKGKFGVLPVGKGYVPLEIGIAGVLSAEAIIIAQSSLFLAFFREMNMETFLGVVGIMGLETFSSIVFYSCTKGAKRYWELSKEIIECGGVNKLMVNKTIEKVGTDCEPTSIVLEKILPEKAVMDFAQRVVKMRKP